MAQIPYRLMLTQGNDRQATEIEQKDCLDAHKTLGVMKAQNQFQAGEIARLTKKGINMQPLFSAIPSPTPTPWKLVSQAVDHLGHSPSTQRYLLALYSLGKHPPSGHPVDIIQL